MSDLFRKLRGQNEPQASPSQSYSLQAGQSHPFRDRPGSTSTTSGSTMTQPKSKSAAPRTKDGDRQHAYQPPAVQDPGVVYEWEPPTFGEILKDLGLRMLEVGIAASAYAIGEEIAYFFRKRRFYTQEQRDRRDW